MQGAGMVYAALDDDIDLRGLRKVKRQLPVIQHNQRHVRSLVKLAD
jgi:hypothetical protein